MVHQPKIRSEIKAMESMNLKNTQYGFSSMKTDVDLMDSRDQILKFEDAKLANIEAFFEERKASYQNTSAVIFLQVGQDDISHDADKVLPKPLSATVEAYFKPDGPRQIPGDDFAAVAAAYEKLVSSTLQWLPWASFLVVSCSAAIAEWICHQTRHNRHEEDS